MPIVRRWVALARRWIWAAPVTALGLTVVASVQAPGVRGPLPLLTAFGVYMAAALVCWELAVIVAGVFVTPSETRERASLAPKLVLAHAGLFVAILPAAVAAGGPLRALVPESLGFRQAIATVVSVHAGVGVAAVASVGLTIWNRKGILKDNEYTTMQLSRTVPFWVWGLAHLGARVVTAGQLGLFAQGREGAIDCASLVVVFGCLVATPVGAGRPWLVRAGVSAGCAAAVCALLALNQSAGLRGQLAAGYPGSTALVSWLRGWLDLDGDGFASVLGGNDCDDGNPRVNPAALEVVGNGVDDNCSGGDLERYQAGALPSLRPNGPRRNLLLVTIDAMRADASGPDQGVPAPMPQLHAFAAKAAVFPRTYVQAPYTTDSLQALLTGHYPMNMTIGTHWLGAEPDVPMLLRGAGYATQAVHSLWLRDPNTKVAAETTTFLLNFEAVDRSLAERNRDPLASSSDAITERALLHFERMRAAGRPFFLWVHYFDMHADYAPHAGTPFAGNSPRDRYLQEAFSTDAAVGRFLRSVEAAGFFDNGIAVVTGDHGELFGEHGHSQHALWMDEACLRTTLLLRGPGFAAGRYDTRVRLVDVAPTVLEQAAGIAIHADGTPLTAVLAGQEREDRDVFVRSTYANRVYKRAAIIGPWKLVQDIGTGTLELFRLDRDPAEQHDLAATQPAERDRLLLRLGQTFDRAMNDRILAARSGR